MMTPTIDFVTMPIVANGPNQAPEGRQRSNQPSKTADYNRKSSDLSQAKQGYATQNNFRYFHQRINTVAKSIHADDKGLRDIRNLLNKAERKLQKIVKTYPPFPAGSEERVKLLRSFNSYRIMIDRLTIPPVKNDYLPNIAIQPKIFTEASPSPENDIDPEQILAPKEDLSILGLPNNATDKEIHAVLDQIRDAKMAIVEKREGVFAKAARIKQMMHKNHPYGESVMVKAGLNGFGDDSGSGAESLSRNLKERLSLVAAGPMYTNRSQVAGLL
jgi:hypothetical protein